MLTRREMLLSVGALGLPMKIFANGPTRFGALQSRAPFFDEHDVHGSRERAFDAYRVLLQRSLDQHGPLDWLAGGAFPLSGPGPFQSVENVALTDYSDEVRWFVSFAQSNRLKLTLGAWWHEPGSKIAPRLLEFDRDGEFRLLPRHGDQPMTGLHLELPQRRETSPVSLAAMCRQRRSYGVRIAAVMGPLSPPGARPSATGGSCILGPDGKALAAADQHSETCLMALV